MADLDGHLRVLVEADVLSADEASRVLLRLALMPPDLADLAVADIENAARYIAVGADPIVHGWRARVRSALVFDL